jgi:hypothetical protein
MLELLYTAFACYRLPDDLQVCEQCGPEWTAQDIRSSPLRSLSLLQLEAIHLMSLDDNGFRHFFRRSIELLLTDPAPVFAFDLGPTAGPGADVAGTRTRSRTRPRRRTLA